MGRLCPARADAARRYRSLRPCQEGVEAFHSKTSGAAGRRRVIFFAPDGDHGACTGFRSDTYLLNDYSFIFSQILSAAVLGTDPHTARCRSERLEGATQSPAGVQDPPPCRRGHRRTRLKVILVRSKIGFVRGPSGRVPRSADSGAVACERRQRGLIDPNQLLQ